MTARVATGFFRTPVADFVGGGRQLAAGSTSTVHVIETPKISCPSSVKGVPLLRFLFRTRRAKISCSQGTRIEL